MIAKVLTLIKEYHLYRDVNLTEYEDTLKVLSKYCIDDLKRFVSTLTDTDEASLSSQPKKVILVSIERGGNIPSTYLNYQISSTFKQEILASQLTLYSLHCPISTRDKKSSSNLTTLPKLKKEIQNIVKNLPSDIEESKIYFIDDLLDSGVTLQLLHKSMCKEYWYSSSSYIFCYAKAEPSQIASSYYMDGEFIPGKRLPLFAAKILKTSKWLRFWYD